MISITPVRYNTNIYKGQTASNSIPLHAFKRRDISDLMEQGDKALNENKFEEALDFYNQANVQNPDDMDVYKKLAKAQFGLKDYTSAEENYLIYLESRPHDIDILIELGETQRQRGFYKDALNVFERAYSLDTSNDLAHRKIMETKNNMLAIFSPERAQREKREYAKQNLQKAIELTTNYMTVEYMRELNNVTIQFGKTASMGGTGNIAQYENAKQAITVSDSYIYAAPQVIAAYLSHESVHAHDHDPYTSVKEEQDAYEIAAKFWIENANGVKDPEMDYAADLYKDSPKSLSSRVEEIYVLRDPMIARTSPNHPPKKFFNWGLTNKRHAASQSIRYDVIA